MPISSSVSSDTNSPMTGIMLKVLSVVAFTVMASCIKFVGQVPAGQIVFYRSIFALPAIIIWLAVNRQLAGAFYTAKPLSHVLRGLIGVTAMGLGFYGLTRLPLPDATALGYAKPLIVVAFSAIFLGEKVRMFRWLAIFIGFIGVVVVCWPNLEAIGGETPMSRDQAFGVMAVLASATLAAIAMLAVRNLVKTERTPTIVIWFSVMASLAGLLTIPFGWQALSFSQTFALICAGVSGGLGQILLTQSYRYGEMSTIAPFEYVSMILSIMIGFWVFHEVPSRWTIAGAIIIIGAGIFIIFRERRLGLKRGAARQLQPPN